MQGGLIARSGDSARPALLPYLGFLALAALTGGASRLDFPGQPLVRLAAILLIGLLLWLPPQSTSQRFRPALVFLAIAMLYVALQLVPLPPALWNILPGHTHYLEAARAANEAQPWRPINLTPERGWNALFSMLPPFAALFASTRQPSKSQHQILAGFIIIVLVSAFLELVQIASGGEDTLRLYTAPASRGAAGLFANRNHQALFLSCGITMLATWWSVASRRNGKIRAQGALAMGGMIFLVLLIPATGSRAGVALCALAVALAIPLALPGARCAIAAMGPRQARISIILSLLILAILLAAAVTAGRADGIKRLISFDAVDDIRFSVWSPISQMTVSFFPCGTGFGSFDPVYRGFEPLKILGPVFMNQAHNDFLQIALEGGLPGILLVMVAIGWWISSFAHLVRRSNETATLLGKLGVAVLLLVSMASIVDYPARTPLMMIVIAQSAAWILRAKAMKSQNASGAATTLRSARLHL